MERVGERRIKSTIYIPLIPAFSLKGEGVGTCVDTYDLESGFSIALNSYNLKTSVYPRDIEEY
jgi:hypothetical protein